VCVSVSVCVSVCVCVCVCVCAWLLVFAPYPCALACRNGVRSMEQGCKPEHAAGSKAGCCDRLAARQNNVG
jgi:hypothetical protein